MTYRMSYFFHQAALTSILWWVSCDVITEFLNITCNNIWVVVLKRPPYRTYLYGVNKLKAVKAWPNAMCAGKPNWRVPLWNLAYLKEQGKRSWNSRFWRCEIQFNVRDWPSKRDFSKHGAHNGHI